MFDYINKVKVQFVRQYGFEPTFSGASPIFDEGQIPDGNYPMEIDGKLDNVEVANGRIYCCRFDETHNESE